MTFVICSTGQAHSGKDTSCDYLVSVLTKKGFKVAKIGLADRLKVICRHLIRLFYNIDIPLSDFYDMDKKEAIHDEYPQFAGQPFKLRTILQLVGTEVFRTCLWADIWCDYVHNEYILKGDYDFIIISDSRFQNEIDYFRDLASVHEVFSFRIVRPDREVLSGNNSTHQSETNIGNLKVGHEIINDKDLDNLYRRLDSFLELIDIK